MNCMKCGREISDGQVFCPECLEVMASFPIAPEIHVQIPRRPVKPSEKKAKTLPPAEQIRHLKKRIRRLSFTVCILLLIIGALSFLLLQKLDAPQQPLPTGRNYTTAPR